MRLVQEGSLALLTWVGEALVYVLSVVSAPVALLGSHCLTVWPVFLRDGHVHSRNFRVLFELA